MSCALCQVTSNDRTYNRVSELDVCEDCFRGNARLAMAVRQFPMKARSWATTDSDGNVSNTYYHFEVTVSLPFSPGVTLKCVQESMVHRLIKLFKREVQVGDTLFDDFVYITTASPDTVADLLASEGLQSAIIGVISGGFFQLEDQTITGYIRSLQPHTIEDRTNIELECAAAALHIQRWYVKHHTP